MPSPRRSLASLSTRPAVLLAVLLALSACSKLTTENYDKVKVGMSFEEVSALLGKADECNDAMVARSCRWGDPAQRHIVVNFVGNSVVLKSAEKLQ